MSVTFLTNNDKEEINSSLSNVETIAIGKNKAYIFDNQSDAIDWAYTPENQSKLVAGDLLLTKDSYQNNFFWDGSSAKYLSYPTEDMITWSVIYDITNGIYQNIEDVSKDIEDVSKAVPTKVSQLEDDTTSKNPIYYAQVAIHADYADAAEFDFYGNDIHFTYATKEELGTIENSDETIISFNFLPNHNKEIRLPTADSIVFTFDDGEYPDNYTSGLVFYSGETPTALTYSGTGILNWVGTDCSINDGLSIFQPSANKQYDIVFYYNGTQFIGLVNGYVPATGNSQG